MQTMRDVLRTTLGRSLGALTPLDRLAAAWPVVAGHAIAGRSAVTALEGSTALVSVPDSAWQRQLQSTSGQLCGDLARTARVPLTAILFLSPAEPGQPRAAATPSRRKPA